MPGAAADDLQVRVINSHNRPGLWPRIRWTVRTLVQLLWLAPRHDVLALHADSNRCVVLGPFLWLIWRISAAVAVHTSGGRHVTHYESLPAVLRWLVRRTVLRAPAVLYETRLSVDYFRRLGFTNVTWLANFRRLQPPVSHEPGPARRFTQPGPPLQGRAHAARRPRGTSTRKLTLDVDGPCMEGITPDDFTGQPGKVLRLWSLRPTPQRRWPAMTCSFSPPSRSPKVIPA